MDDIQIVLYVRHVTLASFRTYTLVVENSVGLSSADVQLVQSMSSFI